jgi:SsrA-binding protein
MTVVVENKKARFEYEILETVEAGIELRGDEVKSLRKKEVSLQDSYAVAKDGQIMLLNCYIAPYSHAYSRDEKADTSRRSRRLLLHKREIDKMIGQISRKGLTIIPLKIYFNQRGFAKIDLGIAKHKKLVDKKRAIKERDIKRETERQVKVRLR